MQEKDAGKPGERRSKSNKKGRAIEQRGRERKRRAGGGGGKLAASGEG